MLRAVVPLIRDPTPAESPAVVSARIDSEPSPGRSGSLLRLIHHVVSPAPVSPGTAMIAARVRPRARWYGIISSAPEATAKARVRGAYSLLSGGSAMSSTVGPRSEHGQGPCGRRSDAAAAQKSMEVSCGWTGRMRCRCVRRTKRIVGRSIICTEPSTNSQVPK